MFRNFRNLSLFLACLSLLACTSGPEVDSEADDVAAEVESAAEDGASEDGSAEESSEGDESVAEESKPQEGEETKSVDEAGVAENSEESEGEELSEDSEFGEEEFAADEDGAQDEEFSDEDFAEETGDSASEQVAENQATEEDEFSDFEEMEGQKGADPEAAPTENTVAEEAPAPAEGQSDFPEPASVEGAEEPPMDESSAEETAALEGVPAKTWLPVQKVRTEPFYKNNHLLNTVYLGRDGDTVESVGQKIFGTDKTDEILKDNPHLSRGMSVGDKLYYNSPSRPGDSSKLLTYYEDNGLSPETYTSVAGDNIRTVSSRLLGHADSWKEVWATNPDVESKSELSEGTMLRYWPAGAEGAPKAPAQTVAEVPPPPMEVDLAPPPPPAMDAPTDAGLPPPSMGSLEPPPPPPPPPQAPPPPPVQVATKKVEGGLLDGLLEDKMILGILGGLVLMLFLVSRMVRKRAVESETALFESTGV